MEATLVDAAGHPVDDRLPTGAGDEEPAVSRLVRPGGVDRVERRDIEKHRAARRTQGFHVEHGPGR
jgi:hypothetical protein